MATTDEVTRDVRANDSNDDDSAEESYKVRRASRTRPCERLV